MSEALPDHRSGQAVSFPIQVKILRKSNNRAVFFTTHLEVHNRHNKIGTSFSAPLRLLSDYYLGGGERISLRPFVYNVTYLDPKIKTVQVAYCNYGME